MSNVFETLQATGKEQVEKALASYDSISKTLQSLSVESGDYAKKSFEAGAQAWQQLLGAKTLESAIEIQTAFAKSSYEGFVAQATRLGEVAVDLGKEAIKPYEGVVFAAK